MLLDGHAIIFRAFFAQRDNPLSVHGTGELTSAVFGFANTLLKVISDLKPTHIAVTLDRAAPTFRHQADANYKANRGAMPDELRSQIKRVRQLIEAFNIPVYEGDGFEADDMLGTLATQAAARELETYLVTLDSDIVQLVQPHVSVYMYRPYQRDTVLYGDDDAVVERYGVRPEQIPDLKALKGDTSDNIPGVRGIGEKTAVKLLNQFGHIENLYEFIHQVTPAKLQQTLREAEEQARKSKSLATIMIDCPVTLDLDRCRVGDYDREAVVSLFRELDFHSLLRRLPEVEASLGGEPAPPPLADETCDYRTVRSLDELDALVEQIRRAGRVAVDTETTSTSAMRARLVGISLATEPNAGWYLPVGHIAEGELVSQLDLVEVLARLGPVMADPTIAKIGHNIKYDLIVLENAGMHVAGVQHDTMIMAYLLGLSSLGLKALAFSELGVEMTPISDLIGEGRKQLTMDQVLTESASPYACADADQTLRLCATFEPRLRDRDLWQLYSEIEIPLVPVLVRMERRGVALDTDALRQMSITLGEEMKRLEGELFKEVGHEFNIGSPKQLGVILFEELNLPKTRRTAQGWSTDAQAMDSLRGTHPVVDLLFEYRQVAKLKSTYVDTLPALINERTGRVHTTYNQTRASTGRLSSEDPNLQNIPIRTELGRGVRRAFIGRGDNGEPWLLMKADYSQVELRILAHISQEPFLLESFGRDDDIHRATAAQLFNIPADEVTNDQRNRAKMINFATIYGLSAAGLSTRSEMSRTEAAEFIRHYFDKLPRVKAYLDGTVASTRERGYAETLMGRRRYIADINSANGTLRAQAERMAMNAPIQGTNSDIIKIAMIDVMAQMQAAGLRSRMILQVHDELVFECPPDEVEMLRALVEQAMPAAMKLDVPLKVESKVGHNWGEME